MIHLRGWSTASTSFHTLGSEYDDIVLLENNEKVQVSSSNPMDAGLEVVISGYSLAWQPVRDTVMLNVSDAQVATVSSSYFYRITDIRVNEGMNQGTIYVSRYHSELLDGKPYDIDYLGSIKQMAMVSHIANLCIPSQVDGVLSLEELFVSTTATCEVHVQIKQSTSNLWRTLYIFYLDTAQVCPLHDYIQNDSQGYGYDIRVQTVNEADASVSLIARMQ